MSWIGKSTTNRPMDGLSPAADTDKLTSPNQFIGQLIDATDDCGTRLCGISHGGRDGMKVQAKLVMNFVWEYVDGIFGADLPFFRKTWKMTKWVPLKNLGMFEKGWTFLVGISTWQHRQLVHKLRTHTKKTETETCSWNHPLGRLARILIHLHLIHAWPLEAIWWLEELRKFQSMITKDGSFPRDYWIFLLSICQSLVGGYKEPFLLIECLYHYHHQP